jgi:hypothetical protein
MTHCTPCIPVSSDNVALGLVTADESHCRVWGRLAPVGRNLGAGAAPGRTDLTWEKLAGWIVPVIRGWMAYYGRFRRSVLDPLLARINHHVQKWIRRKYRRLRP